MIKILLDQHLRTQLGDLEQAVELCDARGQIVAVVLPVAGANGNAESRYEPHFTPEEIARRRNEPGGRSLAEIWERLGKP